MLGKTSIGRHKIIVTGFLYLEKDGKLLLLLRRNTGYCDGDYSLVSGHMDEGETPRSAMVREAQEEAGINIEPQDLEIAHIISRRSHTDGSERIDFFWRCSRWTGEIHNAEPEKCEKLEWYSLGNLPSNLVPELANAIRQIKDRNFYSEMGYD